jgi:O-methyltransferase
MEATLTTAEIVAKVASLTKSQLAPHRISGWTNALLTLDQNKIDGDIVECGVWEGGHIIMARMLSPKRVCWAYDTFAGMTQPGEFDITRGGRKGMAGKSAVPLARVIDNCRRFDVYDHQIRFVVGPVEETLQQVRPEKIALLRLDTDWYSSTKAELEHLWPLLVPGGYLIVDDYGHWLGSRKAVDEFFGDDMPPFKMLDYTAMVMCKQ